MTEVADVGSDDGQPGREVLNEFQRREVEVLARRVRSNCHVQRSQMSWYALIRDCPCEDGVEADSPRLLGQLDAVRPIPDYGESDALAVVAEPADRVDQRGHVVPGPKRADEADERLLRDSELRPRGRPLSASGLEALDVDAVRQHRDPL